MGASLAIGVGLVFVLHAAVRHPINSDDVAWHVALRTWRPGMETLVLPDNSYVLKWPLFLVANLMSPASVEAVIVQSLLLNAVALFLVWHFARYAARLAVAQAPHRPPWVADVVAGSAVAFTWASSELTWDLTARLTNRNLEIGLIAALLELLHRLYRMPDTAPNSFRWSAVAGIVVGIVLLDDPLIAYTIVLPVLAFLTVAALLGYRRPGLVPTVIVSVVAIATWRVAVLAAGAIGVDQVSLRPTVVDVRDLPRQALIGLDALARTFGVTVFSAEPSSAEFWLGVVRIVVFVGAVVLAVRTWRRRREFDAGAAAIAWVAVVLAVFVFSSFGAGLWNIRYVAVAVAAAPAVLSASMIRLSNRFLGAVCAVLLLITALTLFARLPGVADPAVSPNDPAVEMSGVLASLSGDRSDTVVFGDFWNAHVHSYFTDLEPQVLAVGCANGLTVPRYWISDFSRFHRGPAQRTAFIYDPSPGLFTCPRADLLAQFGEPDEIISVGVREVWVFERDLGLFE